MLKRKEKRKDKSDRERFPSLFKKRKLPYGWIQWKGTSVCMDVHCQCGYHGHIDADFLYYIKCSKCGQIYECDGHIDLISLDFDPGEVQIFF